jgi:hypothetical protein
MIEDLRLKVVRGTPTAEEVAALVGVLLLRREAPRPAPAVSRWARSARWRSEISRGPAAWRG